MPQYNPPIRDMQFVLHEVLNVVDELKAMPQHAEVDVDTFNGHRIVVAIFAAYGIAELRSSRAAARAQSRAWKTVAALVLVGGVVPFLPPVHHFVVGPREHLLAVVIPLTAAFAAASPR